MVKSCCAPYCKNRKIKGSTISIHRFPKEEERRKLWIALLNRKILPHLEFAYICGKKNDDKNHADFVSSIKKVNKNNKGIPIEFNDISCYSSKNIYSERSNHLKKSNAEKVLIEENSINSCLQKEIVRESKTVKIIREIREENEKLKNSVKKVKENSILYMSS
nr:THAP domain-containing protein 2-like isoform X2 [Hydra vulgaris]